MTKEDSSTYVDLSMLSEEQFATLIGAASENLEAVDTYVLMGFDTGSKSFRARVEIDKTEWRAKGKWAKFKYLDRQFLTHFAAHCGTTYIDWYLVGRTGVKYKQSILQLSWQEFEKRDLLHTSRELLAA